MNGTEIIMLKHGSSSVENANHIGIDQGKVNFHVAQHVRLRKHGLLTVETASGATVEGKEYALEIGRDLADYDDIEFAQQGTARQVGHWEAAALPYGIEVKQALLTNYAIDPKTDSKEKKLIIPGVLKAVKKGSLVVINEDPFAADEEMEEFEESQIVQEQDEEEDVEPDNDGLASHASIAIGATALLLLSNVEGLKVNGKVRRVVRVEEIDEMILHCDGTSQSGRGGMRAKLLAAEQAAQAGIHVVIGSAFIDDVGRLLEGNAGTTVIR